MFPKKQRNKQNHLPPSAWHTRTYILRLVQRRHADCFDVVQQGGVKVLQAGAGVDHPVLDKDADGSKHEGDKQVHVDVVPGAVKTPAGGKKRNNLLLITRQNTMTWTVYSEHSVGGVGGGRRRRGRGRCYQTHSPVFKTRALLTASSQICARRLPSESIFSSFFKQPRLNSPTHSYSRPFLCLVDGGRDALCDLSKESEDQTIHPAPRMVGIALDILPSNRS